MNDFDGEITPESLVLGIQTIFPSADVFIASESNHSPQSSWGDIFIYTEPQSEQNPNPHRFPFATIVVKDYPDFDEFSDLNRPGIYRLNIGVGKKLFCEVFPAIPYETQWDFRNLNVFMPHPVYQNSGWICILNPQKNMLGLCMHYLSEAYGKSKKP